MTAACILLDCPSWASDGSFQNALPFKPASSLRFLTNLSYLLFSFENCFLVFVLREDLMQLSQTSYVAKNLELLIRMLKLQVCATIPALPLPPERGQCLGWREAPRCSPVCLPSDCILNKKLTISEISSSSTSPLFFLHQVRLRLDDLNCLDNHPL